MQRNPSGGSGATRQPLGRRLPRLPEWRAMLAAAGILLAMAAAWWPAAALYRQFLVQDAKLAVAQRAAPLANALSEALAARFALLRGLAAHVKVDLSSSPDGIPPDFGARFDAYVESLFQDVPGIRNLTVAPGGVQRFVYPLIGNEAVVGHDLLNDPRPEVAAAVRRAMASRGIAVSGPLTLRQGGIGIVGRLAIEVNGTVWGLATMAVDVPAVLHESGVLDQGSDLLIGLRGGGQHFFGSTEVLAAAPVIQSVRLPEGQDWELLAAPRDGWDGVAAPGMRRFHAAFLLVGALCAAVAALAISRHRHQLRAQAHARAAAEAESRAKSAFLANMSHELRTPLNAVIGFSDAILCGAVDTSDPARLRSYIEYIHRSGQHLLTLVTDLLDLSKIEAGRMEMHPTRFDVAVLARDVVASVEPLARRNGNRLHVTLPDDLGRMHADETRVRQVLLNLLSNACKFTREGHVRLAVRGRTWDKVDWLVFAVEDTGCGIAPEDLGRLFQDFSRLGGMTAHDQGGTGLGLSISRHLCRLMGGDIAVDSRPGEGSTFTVTLPRGMAHHAGETVAGAFTI